MKVKKTKFWKKKNWKNHLFYLNRIQIQDR